MNEQTVRLDSRPDAAAFVERVRVRLADLTEEEREDLVGGLEADLSELASEQGNGRTLEELVGEPERYADELRAAAGLGAVKPDGGDARRPVSHAFTAWLDALHATWDETMCAPALRATWDLLVTLRPLWWVFRAWLAVQLLDVAIPGQMYTDADIVPTLDVPGLGAGMLLVAVVLSVQIGRGRLWPGRRHEGALFGRLLLLGLNGLGVVVAPIVVGLLPTQADVVEAFDSGYMAHSPEPGLTNRGVPVRNVFAYDAQGSPLTGVQLFDPSGRPLAVNKWWLDRRDRAWREGERLVFNVFPIPTAGTAADPALPSPPLVAVASVSPPGSADSEIPSPR